MMNIWLNAEKFLLVQVILNIFSFLNYLSKLSQQDVTESSAMFFLFTKNIFVNSSV